MTVRIGEQKQKERISEKSRQNQQPSEAWPQTLDFYKRQPKLAGLFLIGSFIAH